MPPSPPPLPAPSLPCPPESAWLDPGSSLARHLMDGYEAMGHTLALQYGGPCSALLSIARGAGSG